jgi:hypothetical protein
VDQDRLEHSEDQAEPRYDRFELDLDLDRRLDLYHVLDDAYLKGLEEMSVAEVRDRRDECDLVEDSLSVLRRLVQGKLDIVLADLERRAGGFTGGDLKQVVEQLPEILSPGGGRSPNTRGRMRRHIAPDVNYRELTAELDRIMDVETSAGLLGMSEQEVRGIGEALDELEQKVSMRRAAVQDRIDTLQAEIVNRYKSGDANPDDLLHGSGADDL